MAKATVIKAETLYDGKSKKNGMYVVFENEKIIEITNRKLKHDFEGSVTPAFIDAHSHIGMDREGEPWQEGETNDFSNQFLPANDPLNSVYFDDRAFKDSVDFGVLYSCIVPGSGNLIGGKAKIIRNFADSRDDALFMDYGYKMALGFNPRSTTSWKGERPNTRMGIYSMLEKYFDETLAKEKKAKLAREKKLYELEKKSKEKKMSSSELNREKKMIEEEFEIEFTQSDKEILNIIGGKKKTKIHVHKNDDALYMIYLVKKYKMDATADHLGDIFDIKTFKKLAESNIDIVYGPLGSVGYKVELKHAYYQNAKTLMESKAFFGLMTDHPVIHSLSLRDSLKYFMIFNMKEEDAISLITLKNAKILGIEDKLGTIERGKLASIIVWSRDPLHFGSFPKHIFAEGKRIR